MKAINERLNYLLDLKQITPYFLAKKTGISQSTIGRILKQNAIPNNSTLVVLCNYFNVNEDWFRAGNGEIFKNKANITLDYENFDINIEDAISSFETMLTEVDQEIEKLKTEPKTLANLSTLQGFYKLRISLLEDIAGFKN